MFDFTVSPEEELEYESKRTELARSLSKRFDENLALSFALDAQIPSIAGMRRKPMTWQKSAVAYFLANDHNIIQACQPGVGKSGAALMSVVAADMLPCLIVCPATIKEKWKTYEVEECFPAHSVLVCLSGEEINKSHADFVICNPEQLVAVDGIERRRFKSVVLDEAHGYKNRNTKKFRAIEPYCISALSVQLLTGTPVVNNATEIRTLLSLIGKEDLPLVDWSEIQRGGDLEKLQRELRGSGCMLRRTKLQIMPDVPKPDVRPFVVQGDSVVMVEYRAAEAGFSSWLSARVRKRAEALGHDPDEAEMHTILRVASAEALMKLGVLRGLAGRAKASVAVIAARKALDAGHQPLIFCVGKETMNTIAMQLNAPVINGETPVAERQKMVNRYQSGETRAVIASYRAAGTGLTMTAGDVTILTELEWTASAQEQAISRQYRLGQTKQVQVLVPLLADSVDTKLNAILDRKVRMTAAVLDGLDISIDEIQASLTSETETAIELMQSYLEPDRLS